MSPRGAGARPAALRAGAGGSRSRHHGSFFRMTLPGSRYTSDRQKATRRVECLALDSPSRRRANGQTHGPPRTYSDEYSPHIPHGRDIEAENEENPRNSGGFLLCAILGSNQ